jgi:hypothetical protein
MLLLVSLAAAAEIGAGAYFCDLSALEAGVLGPSTAPGLRLRFRWSPRWAAEASFGFGAFADPRLELLRFLGDADAAVVPFVAFGGGGFLDQDRDAGIAVDAGVGLDSAIAPVLDVRTDVRLRFFDTAGTMAPVSAILLSAGLQLHTPRARAPEGHP